MQVCEHDNITLAEIHLHDLASWGKNMEKIGQQQSAQISVIYVLFLCVLCSMHFAILYSMFSVDRNLVLFSTKLI